MELRVCANCQLVIAPGAARAQGCLDNACEPTIRVKPLRWLIGKQFGHYRLDALIAAGGMGAVFRAEQLPLGRTVALKLMQPETDFVLYSERFRREAKLLAQLQHPHIVALHDYDISAMGVPYFVMELIEGQTLSAWIRSHPNGAPREAWLPIAKAIAAALSHAHSLGVIHRDLKPDNVMLGLDPPQTLKLLDFGIGKVISQASDLTAGPTLSATGFIVGTPLYAAPEQLGGEATSAATDQHALALVIAEMIAGRPLRDGNKGTLELLREAVQAPQISRALPTDARTHACLERALQPQPAERFESVAAFIAALESGAVLPAPTKSMRLADPPKRAWGPLASGLLVVSAAICLALAVGIWRRSDAPETLLHPLAPSSALRPFADGYLLEVPPETQRVLGHDPASGSAVLRSPRGWFLRAMSAPDLNLESARFELPVATRFVRYLAAPYASAQRRAGIVSFSAEGLFSSSVDDTERERLAGGASGEAQVDEQGRWLALRSPTQYVVSSIGTAGSEVFRRTLAPTSAIRLSANRLFEVDIDGGINVYALDNIAAPALKLRPGIARLRDVAVLEPLALAALLGEGGEVVVIDLANGTVLERFTVAGAGSALSWIADAPTLLIASDYGLYLWRRGMPAAQRAGQLKIEAERWEDARLIINENFLGVLALDRVRNRLASLDYGELPVRALGPAVHQHWSRTFTDATNSVVYRSYADGVIERISGDKVLQVQAHADDPAQLVFDQQQLLSAASDGVLKRWSANDLRPMGELRLGKQRAIGLVLRAPVLFVLTSEGALEQRHWPDLTSSAAPLPWKTAFGDAQPASMVLNADASLAAVRLRDGRLCLMSTQSVQPARCAQPDRSPLGRLTTLVGARFAVLRQVDSKQLLLLDFSDEKLFALPLFDYASRNVEPIGASSFYLGALGALLRYDFERVGAELRVRIAADVRTDLFYDTVAWLPANGEILTGWRQREGFRVARIDATQLSRTELQTVNLSPLPLSFE